MVNSAPSQHPDSGAPPPPVSSASPSSPPPGPLSQLHLRAHSPTFYSVLLLVFTYVHARPALLVKISFFSSFSPPVFSPLSFSVPEPSSDQRERVILACHEKRDEEREWRHGQRVWFFYSLLSIFHSLETNRPGVS